MERLHGLINYVVCVSEKSTFSTVVTNRISGFTNTFVMHLKLIILYTA